jgi:NurA-like 5'-3' nuclease
MKELLNQILLKYQADRVFICRITAKDEKFNTQQPVLYIETVESVLNHKVEPFKYRGKADHYIYKYSNELRRLFLEKNFYFCENLKLRNTDGLSKFESMYLDNDVYTARAFLLETNGYFLAIHWSRPFAEISKKDLKEEFRVLNTYYNYLNKVTVTI